MVRGHTPSRPAIVRALLNLLRVPLAPGEASSSFGFSPETKSSNACLNTARLPSFGSGQVFLIGLQSWKSGHEVAKQFLLGILNIAHLLAGDGCPGRDRTLYRISGGVRHGNVFRNRQ